MQMQQPPSSPLQQPDRSPSVPAAPPMAASPMAPSPSPHQLPPSSPMSQGQSQFGAPQPPSPHVQSAAQSPRPPPSPHVSMGHPQSPMPPRSPMVQPTQNPLGSPMAVRRPSSTGGSMASSPAVPDRPLSVENPATPRTPQEHNVMVDQLQQHQVMAGPPGPPGPMGGGGGGGGGNPMAPIPLPPGLFDAFGNIRLGLRGGAPMFSTRQQQNKAEAEKKQPVLVGCSSSGVNPRHASLVASDYNYSDDDLASPARSPDSESKKSTGSDDKSSDKPESNLLRSSSETTSILPCVTPKMDSLSAIPKIDFDLPEILLEDDAADSPPPPPTDTIDLAAEAAKVASASSLAEDEDSSDASAMMTDNLTEEEVSMIIGIANPIEKPVNEGTTAKTTSKAEEGVKDGDVKSTDCSSSAPVSKESQPAPADSSSNIDLPPVQITSGDSSSSSAPVVSSGTAASNQVAESDKTKSMQAPTADTPPALSKVSTPSKTQATSVAESVPTSRVGVATQRVHLPHAPALVPVSVITNAPRVLTPVSGGVARPGAPRVAGPRLVTAVMGTPGGDVFKLSPAALSSSVVLSSPRKLNAEEIQGSPIKTSQDAHSPSKQKSPAVPKQTPVLILRPNPGVMSQQTPIQVLQKTPMHFLPQPVAGGRIPKQILVQIPKSQHATQVHLGSKQLPVLVAQHAQPVPAAAASASTASSQPSSSSVDTSNASSPPTVQMSEQDSINLLEKTTVQILQPTAASKKYEALLEAMERIHEGTDSSNMPDSLELQSPIDSEIEQDIASALSVHTGQSTQQAHAVVSVPPQSATTMKTTQLPQPTTPDGKRTPDTNKRANIPSADSKSKVQSEPVFEGLGKTLLQVSLSQSEQKSRVIVRQAGSASTQSPSSFVSGSPKLASLLGATTEPVKSSAKRELLPDLNESKEDVEKKTDDSSSLNPNERDQLISILQDSPAAPEPAIALSSLASTPSLVSGALPSSEADSPEASSSEEKSIDKPVPVSGRRSSQDITITSATDSDSTLTAMTLPPNIRQITSTIYSQSSAERRPPNRPQSQPSPAAGSLQLSQLTKANVDTHSSSAPGSPVREQQDSSKLLGSQIKPTTWNGDNKAELELKQPELMLTVQGNPSKKSSRSLSTSALPSSDDTNSGSTSQMKPASLTQISNLDNKPSLLQAQLMSGGVKKDDAPSLPVGPPPPYPKALKDGVKAKEASKEGVTVAEVSQHSSQSKAEPMDVDEDSTRASSSSAMDTSSLNQAKDEKDESSCSKLLSQPVESQNVLLKQLLQNTACAASPSQPSKEITLSSSSSEVPSLEAQLARPVPPTPSALIPPLLTNDAPPRPTALSVRPITPSKAAATAQTAPQTSLTSSTVVSIAPSTVSAGATSMSTTSVVSALSPAISRSIATTPSMSTGTSQTPVSTTVDAVSSTPLTTAAIVSSVASSTSSQAISMGQVTSSVSPAVSSAIAATGTVSVPSLSTTTTSVEIKALAPSPVPTAPHTPAPLTQSGPRNQEMTVVQQPLVSSATNAISSAPSGVTTSVSEVVPPALSQVTPCAVPQAAPHGVAQGASPPTSVPQAVVQGSSAALHQGVPTSVPQNMPQGVPTSGPHSMPQGAATSVPQSIPQGAATSVPQGVPVSVSQGMVHGAPTSSPQVVAASAPQGVPVSAPQGMSQGVPQGMPQARLFQGQSAGQTPSGMGVQLGVQGQPSAVQPQGTTMQPQGTPQGTPMPPPPGLHIPPGVQVQQGLAGQQRVQMVHPGATKVGPPPSYMQQPVQMSGMQSVQGPTHVTQTQVLSRAVHPGQAPGTMSQGLMSSSVIKREIPSDFDSPSTSTAPSPMDIASQKAAQEQAAIEMKKLKRRQYQQKRRQSQGKESGTLARKRLRRVDEDYDSCMESIMIQLRQLPPMTLRQPQRCPDYAVCCVYGSGNLTKVTTGCRTGDLQGGFGSSTLKGSDDFYATQPYGDNPPVPQPFVATKANFYHLDIGLLDLEDPDEKKHYIRDNDTPDTVISSSSPECVMPEKPLRFPGLRLIDEDLSDEEEQCHKRASPVIPIIAPIPIRLKPGSRNTPELDKENFGIIKEPPIGKSRFGSYTSLKDSANLSVTITISDTSAENICGVLIDLANVLNIAAPTSYQIVDRSNTSPSKLGLYQSRSKDGKESASVDIQCILNGGAKFCYHCDVVILNNGIRRKASDICPTKTNDLPFSNADNEDVYFCGSTCYMQFALMHRSPSISQEKAAALVDHVIQAPSPPKRMRLSTDDDMGRDHNSSDFGDIEMGDGAGLSSDPTAEKKELVPAAPAKSWKGIRFRVVAPNQVPPPRQKFRRPTERELTEMLFRMVITVMPQKMPEDTRKCLFCHAIGDGVSDGPARLLNLDVDKWVHLNCALWSEEVYETVNGALMNIEQALQQSLTLTCVHCQRTGATLRCFKTRCAAVYHLQCAVKDECVFYKNKTLYCSEHVPKNDKENELTTLSVFRRVYINRDENRQVATVMHHADENHLMRVGSLIFLNVGQLLPHQFQNFHNTNFIYPIGYKIVRFYWSMRVANKRCRYICSIHEVNGFPEFRVLVSEQSQEDLELRDTTAKGVWQQILEPMQNLRRENGNINIFPKYISGEDLFGLTEPAIVRILESLPGIETLTDYKFKYGRNPLLELPLAVNPTGCARSEPKIRGQVTFKRPHTQRTAGVTTRPALVSTPTSAGEVACPYSKQFVHSKSSQYKKMKQEWRNNVYLARSKIAGLGLYATRDIERHTMVIEYIGEIIRSELSETREKKYQEKNRGIYMFRLDEDRVVDATLCGGLARYINHSCNPNCVAEIVEVDRDLRIIIFAKRRIQRGEELAYDYKFDLEDDQHKIPCLCGAPNCKKWMN